MPGKILNEIIVTIYIDFISYSYNMINYICYTFNINQLITTNGRFTHHHQHRFRRL